MLISQKEYHNSKLNLLWPEKNFNRFVAEWLTYQKLGKNFCALDQLLVFTRAINEACLLLGNAIIEENIEINDLTKKIISRIYFYFSLEVKRLLPIFQGVSNTAHREILSLEKTKVLCSVKFLKASINLFEINSNFLCNIRTDSKITDCHLVSYSMFRTTI
jgi:hypothetical protein